MLEIYTSPDYIGSLDLEFELRELGLEYTRMPIDLEEPSQIAIRNGVRLVSGPARSRLISRSCVTRWRTGTGSPATPAMWMTTGRLLINTQLFLF